MRGTGILLMLVGASQFVLPSLGVEHVVFRLLGAYRWHGAIGMIVVGAVLLLWSLRRGTPKT